MKKHELFSSTFIFCIIIISFLLNILSFVEHLNQPTYKLGTLKEDININEFQNDSKYAVMFTIPKGTVIKDISPQFIAAAGVFEAHRVGLTVMISPDLIDYTKINDDYAALYRGTARSQK
jgi:hypothetical protein